MAFIDTGPQKPGVEPSIEGDVTFQESLKSSGEDRGEVSRNEEGLVKGKEDGDNVQDGSTHKNILIKKSRAQS